MAPRASAVRRRLGMPRRCGKQKITGRLHRRRSGSPLPPCLRATAPAGPGGPGRRGSRTGIRHRRRDRFDCLPRRKARPYSDARGFINYGTDIKCSYHNERPLSLPLPCRTRRQGKNFPRRRRQRRRKPLIWRYCRPPPAISSLPKAVGREAIGKRLLGSCTGAAMAESRSSAVPSQRRRPQAMKPSFLRPGLP
jgi:hypothetical protein